MPTLQTSVVPCLTNVHTWQLSDILVNASQITRLYSLEQGLGYGRIRFSVLFRAVEAKLPQNLIGFDTGTLIVQDVTVKMSDSDSKLELSKCELRMKITKPSHEEKIARKEGESRDDGSVAWTPAGDDPNLRGLPVRTRYSAALQLSFKDVSTAASFKGSATKRKAFAVLWLRDIADNEERTLEVPLWHAPSGDYSRLKMNYSPPDGNLDTWDDDKEKVQRVGSVWIGLCFKPGIGEGHHDTMSGGGGAKRKEAWDAYTREREGGLRESVGEVGSDNRDEERRPENLAKADSTGGVHSESDSSTYAESIPGHPESPSARSPPQLNTEVSSSAVENEETNDQLPNLQRQAGAEHDDTHQVSDGENDHGHKRGPIERFRDWRQHEKELHREHRGIMQAKPARTVEWVKDNIEDGAHHVKERFSMKSRKPGVETEV